MPLIFEPFMLLLIPPLILALYAQAKVQSTFQKYSRRAALSGATGAEATRLILLFSAVSRK